MGVLETILYDTKLVVAAIKHENTLDASKLVKVTVELATKLYTLSHFSKEEQDALLQFFMKVVLEGLDGFSKEALTAALVAAKNFQTLLPVKKFLACLSCMSLSSNVLDSGDSALVKKAVDFAKSTQESASPSLAVRQLEAPTDTPPQNTHDAEPTPLASQ